MEPHDNPCEPPQAIEASVPAVVVPLRPWGFWATFGWSVLIALGWFAAQVVVVLLLLAAIASGALGPGHDIHSLEKEFIGLTLSLSTIAAGAAGIALCIFAAWLRDYPPLKYLGVIGVSKKHLAIGLVLQIFFMVSSDGITWLLGRPIVPEFMVQAYNTAGWLPLLYLAIVVFAPLAEEVFFRGFLFRGFAESWLGPWRTIVVTSLVWSVIHLQYDWFGITQIFIVGLFLGWLRWRTGSITLTIFLHALQNLVATIEAMMQIELLK